VKKYNSRPLRESFVVCRVSAAWRDTWRPADTAHVTSTGNRTGHNCLCMTETRHNDTVTLCLVKRMLRESAHFARYKIRAFTEL